MAGIDLHFIHEEGRGPNPMPLLLSHGWPGSVWEFHKILPMLTDPARFGGDPADAFTVVAPSLPGYGFSFAPGQPRFGIAEIADALRLAHDRRARLRALRRAGRRLGRLHHVVLGAAYPDRLAGIHLNLLPLRRDIAAGPALAEEKQYLEELGRWLREETGYQWIQGTRPQTLAYGLTDSPVGLAAWIVEKFRTWSDCGGDVERRFSKDELLTNIMLYWVTGGIGASFWPYYARIHAPWPIADGRASRSRPATPRSRRRSCARRASWAERVYNIQRWTVMPAGGHFAAMEEPEALRRRSAPSSASRADAPPAAGHHRRPGGSPAATVGFVVWAVGIKPGRVALRETPVPIARWPADLGRLRIAALADLHTGSPHITVAKLREIVASVNAAQPDLIVLLGDYVIHGVAGGRFVRSSRPRRRCAT